MQPQLLIQAIRFFGHSVYFSNRDVMRVELTIGAGFDLDQLIRGDRRGGQISGVVDGRIRGVLLPGRGCSHICTRTVTVGCHRRVVGTPVFVDRTRTADR